MLVVKRLSLFQTESNQSFLLNTLHSLAPISLCIVSILCYLWHSATWTQSCCTLPGCVSRYTHTCSWPRQPWWHCAPIASCFSQMEGDVSSEKQKGNSSCSIIQWPCQPIYQSSHQLAQCFPNFFEPRHIVYIYKILGHTTNQNDTKSHSNTVHIRLDDLYYNTYS